MNAGTLLTLSLLVYSLLATAFAQETGGGSTLPTPTDVAQQFTRAANQGDGEAVAATFAEDARFDSVGRIYEGRDEIMDRFLIPEVIELGGQYEILDIRAEEAAPEVVVVEYNFRAGSLFEHFTYRLVVRDGLIQEAIGRYVD